MKLNIQKIKIFLITNLSLILLFIGLGSFFQDENLVNSISEEYVVEDSENIATIEKDKNEDFSDFFQFKSFSLASQFVVISIENYFSYRNFTSFKYWLSHSFYIEHCKTLLKSVVYSRKLFCSFIAQRGYYIYCLRKIII